MPDYSPLLRIWFRRIFYVFIFVFVARIVSIAFLLNPTLVKYSPEWLILFLVSAITVLRICFFAVYIAYAVISIIVARALSKNLILISAYFICLPIILFFIAMGRGGIVWGIIGNALLGTTLTIYWLLAREMEEAAGELSLFDHNL